MSENKNDNICTEPLIEHDLWEHLQQFCSYEMLETIKASVAHEARKIVHNIGMPMVLGFSVVSVPNKYNYPEYRINLTIEGAVHGTVRLIVCAVNEDTVSLTLWDDYYHFSEPNTLIARTWLISPKWRRLFTGEQIGRVHEFLSAYDKLEHSDYSVIGRLTEDPHTHKCIFSLEVTLDKNKETRRLAFAVAY